MRLVTTAQVRRRMLGLASLLARLDADEVDAAIEETVDDIQGEIERETSVLLYPRTIKSRPSAELVLGDDYDIEEDGYDWDVSPKARRRFRLRHRPVIQLDRVALVGPQGQTIYTFGPEWHNLKRELGVLTLLPLLGVSYPSGATLAVVGTPPARFGAHHYATLPGLLVIDYQAGLRGADTRAEYADLRNAIAAEAARRVRVDLAERIKKSSSLEGASVSFGTVDTKEASTRFDRFVTQFKRRYAPAKVSVV